MKILLENKSTQLQSGRFPMSFSCVTEQVLVSGDHKRNKADWLRTSFSTTDFNV